MSKGPLIISLAFFLIIYYSMNMMGEISVGKTLGAGVITIIFYVILALYALKKRNKEKKPV